MLKFIRRLLRRPVQIAPIDNDGAGACSSSVATRTAEIGGSRPPPLPTPGKGARVKVPKLQPKPEPKPEPKPKAEPEAEPDHQCPQCPHYPHRPVPQRDAMLACKRIPSGLLEAEGTDKRYFTTRMLNKVLRLALICVERGVQAKGEPAKRCICHGIGTICKASMDVRASNVWNWLVHDETMVDLIDENWDTHLHLWARAVLELVDDPGDLMTQVRRDEQYSVEFNSLVDSVQRRLRLSLVDSWLFVYPAAWFLIFSALEKYASFGTRYIVGVGGPAGAGKSTFTAIVRRFVNFLTENFEAIPLPPEWRSYRLGSYVVGQDGYHYNNETLQDRSLTADKGLLHTFEARKLYDDVERIANDFPTVKCPAYDRHKHDPIPDQILVGPPPAIVMVEGLHVLVTSNDKFKPLQELWDLRLGVTAAAEMLERRCIARKSRSNSARDLEIAREHYQRVDRRNLELLSSPVNHNNYDFLLRMVDFGQFQMMELTVSSCMDELFSASKAEREERQGERPCSETEQEKLVRFTSA